MKMFVKRRNPDDSEFLNASFLGLQEQKSAAVNGKKSYL